MIFKFIRPQSSLPTPSRHHLFLLTTQKSHAQLLKSGIPVHQSPLLPSYCHSVPFHLTLQLFDEIPHWDTLSTTSTITLLARLHRHRDAVLLFSHSLLSNIPPNQFTFGTLLHSSTALHDLTLGKQLHARTTKSGLQSNVFVATALLHHYTKLGTIEEAQTTFNETHEPNVVSYTALISGYLKNGRVDDALWLFRTMPERNVVSWNAMIGGCGQVGLNEEAVNLFVEMCREGVVPTQFTFPSLLSAAANVAALGIGRSFHAASIKNLGRIDVFVSNSLISFYAKCGCLEDSVKVFEKLERRNIVSWNAVICGYAQNGEGAKALELYMGLRHSGMKPNDVTLLVVLFGCNHAGLVDDGYACFKLARDEDPSILRPEHYACVVDMLSRAGRLSEAESFLRELPFRPGIGFWKALLGGCQIHSNREFGENIAGEIRKLNPKDISSYVLLSNAYSAAGNWQRASAVRSEMKEKEMKRVPGCSWIEVRNKIHVFTNGDSSHLQNDEIYVMLKECLKSREAFCDSSQQQERMAVNSECFEGLFIQNLMW